MIPRVGGSSPLGHPNFDLKQARLPRRHKLRWKRAFLFPETASRSTTSRSIDTDLLEHLPDEVPLHRRLTLWKFLKMCSRVAFTSFGFGSAAVRTGAVCVQVGRFRSRYLCVLAPRASYRAIDQVYRIFSERAKHP